MTFYEVIRDNLNYLIEQYTAIERYLAPYEIKHTLRNFSGGAKAFLKDCPLQDDTEKEFYTLFNDKIQHEVDFYTKHFEQNFKGDEVSKRLKTMLWSLVEHAKRLGIFIEECKETVSTDNTAHNNAAIADKIKQIEKILTELKQLL